jgi:hypothetical protein
VIGSLLLGWLVTGALFRLLPSLLLGWIFAGWRPWLMALLIWIFTVFVFHTWAFSWILLPLEYLFVLAGYLGGGTLRTGKQSNEVHSPTPKEGVPSNNEPSHEV